MLPNVVVIDYQVGNIRSVLKMLEKIGVNAQLSSNKETIENASHLIIPGVGHYAVGMQNLERLGLIDILSSASQRKPLLGICLGMQLLFNRSEEAPGVEGLKLINGEFKRFNVSLKVPHIGWNQVYGENKPDIFSSIEDGSNFYFVHSYHAVLNENLPHALTDYEVNFVSAVNKNKIYGTQFHPEKSQKKGEVLLKNFLGLC